MIYNKDYNFKYVNAKPYSLILFESNILHRGRKNMNKNNRIMFEITCGINENITISDVDKIINISLEHEETNLYKENNNINYLLNYKIISVLFFIFIIIMFIF